MGNPSSRHKAFATHLASRCPLASLRAPNPERRRPRFLFRPPSRGPRPFSPPAQASPGNNVTRDLSRLGWPRSAVVFSEEDEDAFDRVRTLRTCDAPLIPAPAREPGFDTFSDPGTRRIFPRQPDGTASLSLISFSLRAPLCWCRSRAIARPLGLRWNGRIRACLVPATRSIPCRPNPLIPALT